jgi:secreted PhoX family phosphatase
MKAFSNKAEAFEAFDDIPTNPHLDRSLGAVVARRYGRRDVLKGLLAVTASTALFGDTALTSTRALAAASDRFTFEEIAGGVDETHHVAPGYEARVLLRWGDPLFADAPAFDPLNQSAAAQHRQFGYNNDYIAVFPVEGRSDRLVMCVNHEYTSPEVMFRGVGEPAENDFEKITRELAEVEMAAHGVSILEIAFENGAWTPVLTSPLNRRISASNTEIALDGPAAGARRMVTAADPSGMRVAGTLNNCAGGATPWGTYLTAEENFHGYFWTDQKAEKEGKLERLTKGLGGAQQKSYERYGVPGAWYNWGAYAERFNVDREPNEPNRFGWIVEIDPTDPSSTPVKHTALGRFRHEGAETVVNPDGRVVVYSGDDARFDYLYRFVSAGRYEPGDRTANLKLLSEGTLSVARFNDDGTVDWLPLTFGEGPLTPQNGFESQADVMIDARLAADLLGATAMDRPEDVQPNAATGKVYVLLTNNARRKSDQINAANPRPENSFGHIIEMAAPEGDHAAGRFAWNILIKCGDPKVAEVGALWGPETSANGWFGSPDNCTIDNEGRLWVATDQGENWAKTGKADGFYAVETEGPARGSSRLFFRVPVGAEMCGPCFTADGETVFLAVQHPGTDGTKEYAPFARVSSFDDPATRWPDFRDGMPPRPSVVAIRKIGGGKIAG